MFNRTKEKNIDFCKTHNIECYGLDDFISNDFDVIINATNVGMGTRDSIFSKNKILSHHTILDAVYNPIETQLIKYAKENKANFIFGTEILLHQAVEQFKIYTGVLPNENVMRNIINRKIDSSKYQKCVVVIGESVDIFLNNLQKAQELCNFVELRVDYIKNLSKQDIDIIAQNTYVESIFTNRLKNDGGMSDMTETQSLEMLQYAMSLGKFSFFDIDVSKAKKFNDILKSQYSCKIILSYHNFQTSLSYNEIIAILKQMDEFKPNVKKIASIVNDNDELYSMINIVKEYHENIALIPMSQHKEFRNIMEILGNWTNFYSLNGNNCSAVGQNCIDK